MTSSLRLLRRAAACASALVIGLAVACSSGGGTGAIANGPSSEDAGEDAGTSTGPEDAAPFASDALSPARDDDGSQGTDDASPPDLAPPPTLSALAPTQAIVGTAGPMIACTGAGFVARSVIQLNGVPLTTSFVSSTELEASIPNGDMSATGTLNVTVGTGPPGGGGTAGIGFQIVNPAPTITALAPTSALLGSAATPLSVTGASFVAGATISLAGTTLPATLASPTAISAIVPASLLATSGLYPVTVTNPAPGGGTSSSIAFVVSNPDVTVSAVTPSTLLVDGPATPIAVVGTGFVAASAVSFNGTAVPTTFTSATQLAATVPAGSLSNAGSFPVAVTNPAPGGGVTAPFTVTVAYPAPTATSLAPASVTLGAPPPTIVLTGTGFITGATTIAFDGVAALTTVTDSAHASAALTTVQAASPHTFQVTATNPTPGGGSSAPLSFSVNAGAPTATSVAPSFALVGASTASIVVTGSDFVSSSTVLVGSTPIATTFVNGTTLDAVIPGANLTAATSLLLAVSTPAPGGGTSGTLGFTVDNPGPTVTAVTPSSVIVPAGDTPITVTGTGIISGASVIELGGSPLATTYAGGALGATIPASDLGAAATLSITIANPAPGGGTSNVAYFAANDPLPAITAVSPTSIYALSGATPITLTGSGFVAGSAVQANGATLTVTAESATSLTATVPASMLTAVGTLSITVTNRAPGGGASAPVAIPVGCNTSGASVVLSALSTPATLSLSFASAPTAYRITTSEENDLCPSTDDTTGTSPYLGYVVVNDTAASATLSAWAVCSANNDAFLTFYPGATIPTTQAGLEACTGYVAEGKEGAGALNSSQAGPSDFCPGLTKANGAGLTLASCATAVVLIQPYSATSETYPPPSSLVIELQ